MTLQSVEPTRMTIDSRRYVWCTEPELSLVCDIPWCRSGFRLQKHHIVRRSATGGPLDYITIDGLVVQNVCMLCREHHDQITGSLNGHKLWIVWADGWQVYEQGYPYNSHWLVGKNGNTYIRVGQLQMSNHNAS